MSNTDTAHPVVARCVSFKASEWPDQTLLIGALARGHNDIRIDLKSYEAERYGIPWTYQALIETSTTHKKPWGGYVVLYLVPVDGEAFFEGAKHMVACLLYTSPSPRD